MMNKTIIRLMALSCMTVAAACSADSDDGQGNIMHTPLNIAVDIDRGTPAPVTRGTNINTFDNDDIIYVGKNDMYKQRMPVVAYTYDASKSYFVGPLEWDNQHQRLFAFRRGDGKSELGADFEVPSDQSYYGDARTDATTGLGHGLIGGDLMYTAEKEVFYYNSGTTGVATLNNFIHRPSMLRVVVTAADTDAKKALLQECTLCGGTHVNGTKTPERLYMKATVNGTDGTLTRTGDRTGTIKMYHRPGTNFFECYVIPGQTINLADIGCLVLKYNDKTYYYSKSGATQNLTFVANTIHTVTFSALSDKPAN